MRRASATAAARQTRCSAPLVALTLDRSSGSRVLHRRGSAAASAGAWHHSSSSANSCSRAAAWTMAASGSVRCTANASAKLRPRCARRSTRLQPIQCGRLVARRSSTVGCARESAKERRDSHHHQRRDHCLASVTTRSAAMSRRVGEDLQRHQRVAADHLADAVGVDVVLVRARSASSASTVSPQNRDLRSGESRVQAATVARRSTRSCRQSVAELVIALFHAVLLRAYRRRGAR